MDIIVGKSDGIYFRQSPGRNADSTVAEGWTERYIGPILDIEGIKFGYFTQRWVARESHSAAINGC